MGVSSKVDDGLPIVTKAKKTSLKTKDIHFEKCNLLLKLF